MIIVSSAARDNIAACVCNNALATKTRCEATAYLVASARAPDSTPYVIK